jgi:type II secretory pathway pseudopilin PulG
MAQQNQQQTTGNKISTSYVTFIVVIVIVISLAALVLAGYTYSVDQNLAASAPLAAIGLIAMALSVFILFQSRRQSVDMKVEVPKVMTTIECSNKGCAAKTIREYQRGDYVFKDVDVVCAKCGGKQMITAIYKEVKEKEKNYNV